MLPSVHSVILLSGVLTMLFYDGFVCRASTDYVRRGLLSWTIWIESDSQVDVTSCTERTNVLVVVAQFMAWTIYHY